MSNSNNKTPIWHDTAIKLIHYANKFKNTSDEFERQVGYLLLDVGVETLFRSYLTMPDTKAKLAFSKREEASKGTVDKKDFLGEKFTLAGFDELSFHKLVDAVRQVAEASLNENDLKEAEHYHNIRNKIYHLGEGIIPAKEKFAGYLQLAERLLATLLDVNKPTKDTSTAEEWDDLMHEAELSVMSYWMKVHMPEEFQDLQLNIAVAAEIFNPKYTRKSFEKGLKEIQDEYQDNENADVSGRYGLQQARTEEFQKLTGTHIDDIDFIDKVLNDVAYLHLMILLNHKVIDNNDIDKYFEYREFAERFHNRSDDASRETREKILQLQDWAKKIEEKLDMLDPKHKSDSQKEEDI